MKLKILFLLFILCLPSYAAYAYKRTISCGSATSSNQTNFPLLIEFNSSNSGTSFKDVGHSGRIQNSVTQSGGNAVSEPADLIFTSDAGGTTKIPWETEYWDNVNGTLWVWVQVSSLVSSGHSTIYVFYDDSGVSTQQNTGSNSPSHVWDSNYALVKHFPNGSTLSLLDSTSNTNTSTNHSGTATTGNSDGGLALSGSSQYVDVTTASNLAITGDITIEAWVNPGSISQYNFIIGKDKYYAGLGQCIAAPYEYRIDTSTGKLNFLQGDGGANGNTISWGQVQSSSGISASAWSNVAVTLTGTSVAHYLNGSTNGSGTMNHSESTGDAGTDLLIGTRQDNYAYFNGTIDELRISNIARSASYIATTYNNLHAPSTFSTVGAETSTSGGGSVIRHKANNS